MKKNPQFHFSDKPDARFLLGAYRSEKGQLSWIIGEKPSRHETLYNVRLNDNLFSQREGGIASMDLPDYVLLYDCRDIPGGYHLFRCVSSSVKDEAGMRDLQYPCPDGDYLVYLLGDEIQCEPLDVKSLVDEFKAANPDEPAFSPFVLTGKEIATKVDYSLKAPSPVKKRGPKVLRFIDLFAGIGGIRCGLEQAAREAGLEPVCVFTSEIKPYAVKVLLSNHPGETVTGDITKVETKNIPDFDILCAGFPCQAFSAAGKRQGFADTRGTMFFEVERILRDKRPRGFILENVEGLVNHDGGRTLKVIEEHLESLNYQFDYKVLNSRYFGVPQERKRIYIVGTDKKKPDLENFPVVEKKLSDILQSGLETSDTPFVNNLLKHYKIEELYGKSIKDKRGGEDNIHSWDLGTKGEVTDVQKRLLDSLLKERRKKKWAEEIGIDWMDGMPLTLKQIKTFFDVPDLQSVLDDLTAKGYLRYEHPKKLVVEVNDAGVRTTRREPDTTKPKGYNIVAGKLSFEINKVMSPDEIAPTLVAMDMQKLYVGDNGGLRKLSLREGLRLFGYPEEFIFDVSEKDGFDLLGNTVVVPVIKAVASRMLKSLDFK